MSSPRPARTWRVLIGVAVVAAALTAPSTRVAGAEYGVRGYVSAYDASKAMAHEIANGLARDGHPIVIVMPGLVYGPGDTALTGDAAEARRESFIKEEPTTESGNGPGVLVTNAAPAIT